MRIRAIYKAGKEFKDFHYNLKHAFEDKEHFTELNISEEERKREIDEYTKSKQIFLLEDLYVAVLDEDSPDLNYQKEDLVLFSNSTIIEKKCLVVCEFKDEFLLAHYIEDIDDEKTFCLLPILDKYSKLSNKDNEDLKIFGMVIHLHRLSKDWQERFKENNDKGML